MPTVVYPNCECCASSSSSSKSSSSSSSSNGRCCNAPDTLHVSIGAPTNCACFTLTSLTLTYDSSSVSWKGAGLSGCPAGDLRIRLVCASGDGWEMHLSGCSNSVLGKDPFSYSCNPLHVEFHYSSEVPLTNCCNGSTGGFTLTVTV